MNANTNTLLELLYDALNSELGYRIDFEPGTEDCFLYARDFACDMIRLFNYLYRSGFAVSLINNNLTIK